MSSDPGLNSTQRREVEALAELSVRRYFDHYLENIFPAQIARIEKEVDLKIRVHNSSSHAHGRVERTVTRTVWLTLGAALAGASGAGGAELLRVMLHL